MDDLLKQIKQYKEPLVIGLAILMLIFYGFCPVIDILGKAKANGLKVLFGVSPKTRLQATSLCTQFC